MLCQRTSQIEEQVSIGVLRPFGEGYGPCEQTDAAVEVIESEEGLCETGACAGAAGDIAKGALEEPARVDGCPGGEQQVSGAHAGFELELARRRGSFEVSKVGDGIVGATELNACVSPSRANRMSGGGASDGLVEEGQALSRIRGEGGSGSEHQGRKGGVGFGFCGTSSSNLGSIEITDGGEQLRRYETAVDGGHCFDDGCEGGFAAIACEQVDLRESQGEIGVARCRLERVKVVVPGAGQVTVGEGVIGLGGDSGKLQGANDVRGGEQGGMFALCPYPESVLRFFPSGEVHVVHRRQSGACIEERFSDEERERSEQSERAALTDGVLSDDGFGRAEGDGVGGDTEPDCASLGDDPPDAQVVGGEDRLESESALVVVDADDDAVMGGEQLKAEMGTIERLAHDGREGLGELGQGHFDCEAVEGAATVSEAGHPSGEIDGEAEAVDGGNELDDAKGTEGEGFRELEGETPLRRAQSKGRSRDGERIARRRYSDGDGVHLEGTLPTRRVAGRGPGEQLERGLGRVRCGETATNGCAQSKSLRVARGGRVTRVTLGAQLGEQSAEAIAVDDSIELASIVADHARAFGFDVVDEPLSFDLAEEVVDFDGFFAGVLLLDLGPDDDARLGGGLPEVLQLVVGRLLDVFSVALLDEGLEEVAELTQLGLGSTFRVPSERIGGDLVEVEELVEQRFDAAGSSSGGRVFELSDENRVLVADMILSGTSVSGGGERHGRDEHEGGQEQGPKTRHLAMSFPWEQRNEPVILNGKQHGCQWRRVGARS